jgi:hypothetical protein
MSKLIAALMGHLMVNPRKK